jgi:hypothetical protein
VCLSSGGAGRARTSLRAGLAPRDVVGIGEARAMAGPRAMAEAAQRSRRRASIARRDGAARGDPREITSDGSWNGGC